MEKRTLHSPNVTTRNIERIAEVFPQVMTESRDAEGNVTLAVDLDLLRQELSDHVVEGPQERYQLDWPGKRAAAFAANAPIAKTLRPVRQESVDFDTTKNLFIEGDNLDALKLLQESYLGKVKLIYIDPPYNTGNDFVYEDNFAETTAEHLRSSAVLDDEGNRLRTKVNSEASGRFHSDWLSMMYPRLKLARSLLADDGVVIVAIDDHEHANLRSLLDQVLGSENFIANVTWQGTGKNDARYTAGGVDYMLIYAKNESLLRSLDTRWKEPKPGIDEVEAVARRAWQESDGDPAKATTIFRNGVRAIKADLEPAVFRYDQIDDEGRVFQATDITSPNPRPNLMYELTHPKTGRAVRTPANGWRYSRETMDELIAQGRVLFGPDETTSPRIKRFLAEQGDRVPYPTFTQSRMPGTKKLDGLLQADVFDFPKDTAVLARWFGAITRDNPDAVILDFFAGSGSTGHAVMDLNAADGGHRRYILVQLDEPVDHPHYETIAGIARERLRRAGAQVKQAGLLNSALDIGFRSLHVATTNMADTLATADDLEQYTLTEAVRSVKPDRTDEDLLFQVLLDWGLDLAEPIAVEDLGSRRVLSVAEGALIACFADEMTDDVVKEIAGRRPLRAVFLDAGFASDAARINAEQIFREVSPETEVRTI
ncbi:site-specific DNA-methyltransferase [Nocardioides perillae]|uniref:Adenine-specific DNA-methyltransferase n=1 Tax=Nocardioides perillae TaxID=1119534 RepID=A0A7Y9RU01_9ACTN|nr:site-specific DNA-methyltransferase [Nocardioides perillae]NYG55291.1 adenine-specific DNA-methyltransferase [Nocardioides perillae]